MADPLILEVEAAPGSTRGVARLGDLTFPVALGRSGIRHDKREGDGATPSGVYRLRRVFYRADRIDPPNTDLPTVVIEPDMGWCDDQGDPERYNRLVRLPYAGSHERMWREDALYDLVVEIDHNTDPAVPGFGSAVFLHLARDDWSPTEGCVGFDSNRLKGFIQVIDHLKFIEITISES